MEIVGYSICNDSVTGIVTACRAGADVGGGTKDVDKFALACTAVLVRVYKGLGRRVDSSYDWGSASINARLPIPKNQQPGHWW